MKQAMEFRFPIRTLIMSRTDNLGDVMLTLPLLGYLKSIEPTLRLLFLGKKYTKALVEHCPDVDEFIDRDFVLENPDYLLEKGADAIIFVYPDAPLARLAKKAKIAHRVGSSHRWFHWNTCNHRVNFSRRRSPLHESQLNFKLLAPLLAGEKAPTPSLHEMADFLHFEADSLAEAGTPGANRFRLIIHPKSKGSAREWPLAYYARLIEQLPEEKFQIFMTGTEAEEKLIQQEYPALLQEPRIENWMGKVDLHDLIRLIASADGLLAASTGPLHMAAALGKYALGIYPPIRPMDPGRWQPIGRKAWALASETNCDACRKTGNCACIRAISVARVHDQIETFYKEKYG